MNKFVAGALALLITLPAAADPHPKAAEIHEYRETVMDSLGKHMKATSMILKEQVDRKDDVMAHARALAAMAPLMCTMYPAGTGPEDTKTHAKAEIWTKAEDFQKACDAFTEATTTLVAQAESGDYDSFKAAFKEVGKSCGNCHDQFRTEDE